MKIKRWICTGEIGDVKSTEELLETAGVLLDKNETGEILNDPIFEGEDGKFYRVNVEAVIVEEDPKYVEQLDAEMGEPPANLHDMIQDGEGTALSDECSVEQDLRRMEERKALYYGLCIEAQEILSEVLTWAEAGASLPPHHTQKVLEVYTRITQARHHVVTGYGIGRSI